MGRLCLLATLLFASVLQAAALEPAAAVEAAAFDQAAVEAAANKAAGFLLKQQNANGTFGKSRAAAMPGLVGLVVEAVATAPEKPREANTPELAKAAEYMLSKQQASGAIALPEMGLENYNTAVAVIGLLALENPAHKDALEKARAYLLSCQHDGVAKDDPAFGGFGYNPRQRPDLSNTGFSLEALKALGLKENSPAFQNALIFIRRCQDNGETNDTPSMKGGANSGGFVYYPGASPFGTHAGKKKEYVPRPYGSMTYEAVKSLAYAAVKKDDPVLQAAFKWIKANYNVKEHPGAVESEGYFYYVMAMAKAMSATGMKEIELADGRKANWARDLAARLIAIQKPDGSFANSDARWMEDDPVLATSYALRALNLCAETLKK